MRGLSLLKRSAKPCPTLYPSLSKRYEMSSCVRGVLGRPERVVGGAGWTAPPAAVGGLVEDWLIVVEVEEGRGLLTREGRSREASYSWAMRSARGMSSMSRRSKTEIETRVSSVAGADILVNEREYMAMKV